MERKSNVRERDHLTITEMTLRYCVSAGTLSSYEEKGLLAPWRAGPQRYYTGRDRTRVEMVLTGERRGFTVQEIVEMLHSNRIIRNKEPKRLVETLDSEAIQEQIAALEGQRADIEAAMKELTGALPSPPEDVAT